MKRSKLDQDSFQTLRRGDIVCNVGSGESYVIERGQHGADLIAIRSVAISNPSEWELIEPSRHYSVQPIGAYHNGDPKFSYRYDVMDGDQRIITSFWEKDKVEAYVLAERLNRSL